MNMDTIAQLSRSLADRFVIERELGGGMSRVYVAEVRAKLAGKAPKQPRSALSVRTQHA